MFIGYVCGPTSLSDVFLESSHLSILSGVSKTAYNQNKKSYTPLIT